MQPERVQKRAEALHKHQHPDRCHRPHGEPDEHHERRFRRRGRHQDAVQEHRAELRVRERQRPQTQVRRRVAHRAEDELDRVDHLVHEDVPEIERLAVFVLAGEARVRLPSRPRVVASLQNERLRQEHHGHGRERDDD
eukprot:30927-Pelagococcus_subviridis.AAC.11